MKTELKAINSKLNNSKQKSDLETTQSEEKTDRKMKKNKESNIWDLWDNIKHANLQIRVPEEKKREREKRGSKMYLRKLQLKTSQT